MRYPGWIRKKSNSKEFGFYSFVFVSFFMVWAVFVVVEVVVEVVFVVVIVPCF